MSSTFKNDFKLNTLMEEKQALQKAREEGHMIVKCKFCSVPIRWLTTVKGKKMPVDGDSRPYWLKPRGGKRIVTAQGEVFSCEYEGGGKPDGHGYVPHAASCTHCRK